MLGSILMKVRCARNDNIEQCGKGCLHPLINTDIPCLGFIVDSKHCPSRLTTAEIDYIIEMPPLFGFDSPGFQGTLQGETNRDTPRISSCEEADDGLSLLANPAVHFVDKKKKHPPKATPVCSTSSTSKNGRQDGIGDDSVNSFHSSRETPPSPHCSGKENRPDVPFEAHRKARVSAAPSQSSGGDMRQLLAVEATRIQAMSKE